MLQGLGVRPDFAVAAPAQHALDYIHRRTDTEDIYFVTNGADEPVYAECTFRVPAGTRPSLWHAEDGRIEPCAVFRREADATRVPLRLPQRSSVFVVFRAADADADHVVDLGRSGRAARQLVDPDVEVLALAADHLRVRAHAAGTYAFVTARGRTATVAIPDLPAALAPTGPWQLRFPPTVPTDAPAQLELDAPVSWTELEPELARYYAGTAYYTAQLTVPRALRDPRFVLTLDLGAVAEVAEVAIQGAPAAVLWKAPYRVDVTRLLEPGANRIDVAVTNLWHNRIVGDLRSPDAPAHATTNLKSRFRADMPLLPSGLLGPVSVRAAVEVDVRFD